MFCVKCGSQLQPTKFCTNCGLDNSTYAPAMVSVPASVTEFAEKPAFCIKCGSELYPKTRICPNCQFDNTDYVPEPPVAQQFQVSSALLYRGAYSEGKVLVVPRNATLPASCVKCGGIPKHWLQKKFYWNTPWLYLLLLLGLLGVFIYAIVVLVVRKRVRLEVPLCEAHNSARKAKFWIGLALLLGCVPVPWILVLSLHDDFWTAIAVLLGVFMFILGAAVISFSNVLRPTYIGDDCAKFKGAHPEFLGRLGISSIPGIGTQTQAQSSGL